MAVRFYIVPKTGDGLTPDTAFSPKYVAELLDSTQPGRWRVRDYGMEPVMLVGANVTPEEHATITNNVDVISIPQNLDATISLTALSTVQNRLEALRIPAAWVTTSNTYRDVLRVVYRVFSVFGRFWALYGKTVFESGITLDTRMNEMTAGQRNALSNVLTNSLGLGDLSWITNTATMRQVLKGAADRLPAGSLMGETF